jgi:ADYC domain
MSRTLALVALWSTGGCVVGEDTRAHVDQAVLTQNGVSPNGVSPNGVSPNGVSPNGVSPNGVSPNGVSPNGVSLNGVSPNGVSPNGTPLGIAGTGAPLSGAELVGSTWTGLLSNGATVALRIDAAAQLTGGNADLWSYRMSVSADGTWRPLCVDTTGTPSFAESVPGTWNLAQGVPGGGSYLPSADDFTLACRGSAIAKCVELGYKPWTGHEAELETCVRALRGDYCGDGTPYTVDGTLVNLFDAEGIQTDDVDWEPEAEWTPEGARCISKKKQTRFDQVAHQRPSCFPDALASEKSCGTGFTAGALIITELVPR